MPHKFKPIITKKNSVDGLVLINFFPHQNKKHLEAQLNSLSFTFTRLKNLLKNVKQTKVKGIFEEVNKYFDEIETCLFCTLQELYRIVIGSRGEIRYIYGTEILPAYAQFSFALIHRDLENINYLISMLDINTGYTKRQAIKILKAKIKKRIEYNWMPDEFLITSLHQVLNNYIYQFQSVLDRNESNRLRFSFAYANRYRHLKKKGK